MLKLALVLKLASLSLPGLLRQVLWRGLSGLSLAGLLSRFLGAGHGTEGGAGSLGWTP